MTWTFKDGTGGCDGQSGSPGFPGCGGIYGVSSVMFSYLYEQPFEALLLTSALSISSL